VGRVNGNPPPNAPTHSSPSARSSSSRVHPFRTSRALSASAVLTLPADTFLSCDKRGVVVVVGSSKHLLRSSAHRWFACRCRAILLLAHQIIHTSLLSLVARRVNSAAD